MYVHAYVNMYVYIHVRTYLRMCLTCSNSARNKDQKLVGRFFEDRIFDRLLIAVPLKMYRKDGRPKWILVSQMLKLVGKWPMANCYF